MKERLTGAIILVALIVLLVPELLTGPVRSAPRAAVAASSAEEPPLRSYTINLADDAHAHSSAQASGPEQPAPLPSPSEPAASPTQGGSAAAPSETPAPAASPAPPPPSTHPASTPASATPTMSSAAAAGGAFMVQLGSFANRANAEHLAQQLRAQGYGVSVSQGSGGRHLYRVRVGPARDHAQALQLAQQLRSSGHGGSVVPK